MQRSSNRLRIYVCGRLVLARGDIAVPESALPARQGRRLWAFLVLNRWQPIGRIDLATAIWGDDVPDAWDIALSSLASRLRRSLLPVGSDDGPKLLAGVNRYELRLPSETVIDFERARAALHQTDTLFRAGAFAEALGEARVAIEIAVRGFLPGESGPWVEGTRRLLRSVHIHALEYTVEAELNRGHPDTAEREAEQLLALEPLNERAHQLLMRAMAARGNHSGVSQSLAQCRRLFASEGLSPSIETERLARELSAR